MNPPNRNNSNYSELPSDPEDIKDDNQSKPNPLPPAYYSFPTFNNSNKNIEFVNDHNNSINQNTSNPDSYYNSLVTTNVNPVISRNSSQYNKDEFPNQNNSNCQLSSINPNLKDSKSHSGFNSFINNKVSSIKEFTKKNILQMHKSQIPTFSSTSSSNIHIATIDDDDDDNEALLTQRINDNNDDNENNDSSSENEITDITIIPTTNMYPLNNNPILPPTNNKFNNSKNNNSSSNNNNNNNNNENNENNNNNNDNNNNSNNNKRNSKIINHHLLRRNTIEESLTNLPNTDNIFNSDHYSPEYDFLIQLLSIPNDNLIIKNAIQHRISYLQEYVDETRRYTQLSKNLKLRKSILIQAITLFVTIFLIFKSSFFFIEDENENSYNQEKINLLKLLGFLLLFYNELIFVQNSLLSVHSIAIGNIDIIFGNHDNGDLHSSSDQVNKNTPLIASASRQDYGSMDNFNETFSFDYYNKDNNNILYRKTNKLEKRMSDKNYFSQEKAFYTRNNLSVDKLNFSLNSLDDICNSYVNISIKNNNVITHKSNDLLNSTTLYKNNKNESDSQNFIKKTIYNYSSNKTTPSEINSKNRKNNNDDDPTNNRNIENNEYVTSIPNNKNFERFINDNQSNTNRSNSNQNLYYNQIDESQTHTNKVKDFFKKFMDKLHYIYFKFCNIPTINRFIKNKSNYYEEIKKTVYQAICQGIIWGIVFSFIGYFYSDQQIKYSFLILFSFIISSLVMALIASINPVMVKIIQISDPIFVVGPFEILIQISLSLITYKIGMSIL